MTDRRLEGRVALVTGASRGGGKGIALVLGEQGATVYVTGRSVRGEPTTLGRPGTIDDTADDCETVVRPSSADILAQCVTWGKPSVALTTSRDRGQTWSLRTARISLAGLVIVSGNEAWAASDPYHEAAFRAGIPRKLWPTTDAGAMWH